MEIFARVSFLHASAQTYCFKEKDGKQKESSRAAEAGEWILEESFWKDWNIKSYKVWLPRRLRGAEITSRLFSLL